MHRGMKTDRVSAGYYDASEFELRHLWLRFLPAVSSVAALRRGGDELIHLHTAGDEFLVLRHGPVDADGLALALQQGLLPSTGGTLRGERMSQAAGGRPSVAHVGSARFLRLPFAGKRTIVASRAYLGAVAAFATRFSRNGASVCGIRCWVTDRPCE